MTIDEVHSVQATQEETIRRLDEGMEHLQEDVRRIEAEDRREMGQMIEQQTILIRVRRLGGEGREREERRGAPEIAFSITTRIAQYLLMDTFDFSFLQQKLSHPTKCEIL